MHRLAAIGRLRRRLRRYRRGVGLLAVLLILLGLFSVGCRNGALKELPKEIADVLPAGQTRPVEVVLASPQGTVTDQPEAEPLRTIAVAFNQPMVPLQPVPIEESSAPMVIEPAVPGRFRWKGTATLTFEAKDPLPYGTRFKVRVPKGTKSWSKQELAADYQFEFVTPVAGLLGSLPMESNHTASPNAPIYLHFNQPMDPQTAASNLSLQSQGKPVEFEVRAFKNEDIEPENKRIDPEGYGTVSGSSAYFRSEWIPAKDAPGDKTLVVVPRQSLGSRAEVKLTLKAGLKGRQGQVGLEREQILSFRTYGPLAYLPEKLKTVRPEDGLTLHFSNGVNPAELVKRIKIEPKVTIPEYLDHDTSPSNDPTLYLALAPRKHYKVSLDKGLKDRYGQALGKDIDIQFTTGDFQPAFHMPEGLGLLESKGPLRLPVGLCNIHQADIDIATLDRQKVIAVLESSKALYARNAYTPPGGFTRHLSLAPSSQPNKLEDRPITFTPADGSFVYIQARPDASSEEKRAVVIISDIGLTCKSSPENCVIWATSLKDARPLAGAEIEIRDNQGKPLWTGKTDSNGTLQGPGWAALGVNKKEEYESAPELYVFAKLGTDETFVRTTRGSSINFSDMGSISFDWSQQARNIRGYAFSERGLYKPGEKVELKGSARELKASQWIIPDLKQFPFKVEDSRGNAVASGNVSLNEFGGFTHSVPLTAQAPTGHYSVSYMLPEPLSKTLKLPRTFASAHFQVEAFRPAQFEVTTTVEKPYYIMGDKAKATIKGWYLFGAPMNESAVKWTARLEPAQLQPAGAFEGYSFWPLTVEEDSDRSDSATKIAEQTTVLDEKGLKTIDINLENQSYKGSASLVVEATITSAGRQQLSGSAVVPLHRGEFQIGLRGSSGVGKAGEKFALEALAVDPAGKLVPGQKVKLELLRREWKSVRKAGPDGRYQWVSDAKDESVNTQEFTSADAASSVAVTPPKAGYYVVRATAQDSRKSPIVSEFGFYVTGKDYVGWQRREGDQIVLVPDKKGYKPGDTARILIQNPYEGKTKALITLEREHILQQWVQDVEGSSPTLDIPLRSQHLPNVYLSVVLVKGRLTDKGFGPDGDDLGKPSFRIGYCNLPVQTDEKKLSVTLKTDKESYQPGDEVTVTAEIKDAKGQGAQAEFSLAAADLGVLNLINFQTPNYFDTFYGSRSLAVANAESRLDVIGQRVYGTKGAIPGSGGGENGSSTRQDFKFTAYWDPSVRTDANGRATVKFKLPDNLSTFRLMAVAQTKGSDFGSGESKFTVQKMLMAQPSVPSFARLGDDFQAGVVVHNNSAASVSAEVDVQTSNLPIIGESHKTISVAAGKEQEVLFHFKPEKVATAELTFSAKGGGAQDAVKIRMPLQQATVTETVATSNSLTDSAAMELAVPGSIAPDSGFVEVNLSSSALLGVQGAAICNLNYSHVCLEQRLSKMMPVLASKKLIQGLQLKDYTDATYKALIEEQLAALPAFQDENGGFRLWPDPSCSVNDYVTAYLLEVTWAAKQAGYKVDEKLVNKTIAYLRKVLANESVCKLPYTLDEQWVNKTYALYAISLWSKGDASELNRMFGERAQMSLSAKSYLLQAANHIDKSDSIIATLRQELTNSAHLEAATAYFSERKEVVMPWIYSSQRASTALVLKAMLDCKASFELAPKVVTWLMEKRDKQGTFGDTHCNTIVLQAFGAYLDKFEKDTPDFTAKVKLGGEEFLSQSFKGRNAPAVRKVAPLKAGSEKLPISFEKSGPGRLYYDLRLTYANLQVQPARDEGLAIFKSISDVKTGKKLAEFKSGNTYMVTLSVVTPAQRHFVVLSDPVPAGFEVVHTDFATESREMSEILNRANQKTPGFTFGHFETYDDRVLLFADGLEAGEHTFRYLLRANQPGSFLMPSSKGEEMYHPEVFGITAPMNITIK